MAYQLTQQIQVLNKYSNIDLLYGPYSSKEQACAAIPEAIRNYGKTVLIGNNSDYTEYWWKDDLTNNGLIPKISDNNFEGELIAEDIKYENNFHTDINNVETALNKLLNKVYYSAVSISSFTGGGTYEVGTEISRVPFAWSLNKNPLSIAIKQGTNIVIDDLSVDSRSYTYTPTTAIKSNTTFTLTCGDVTDAGVATSRTAQTTLSFLYKLFYNTITSNTPSTQNEIEAMGVGGNTTKIHWSNSKTITHAFKGKKFCIALPSSMKISKAVTSNNETITSKFVAGSEIDYTIGSTTTKYKVHTFEVAAEMDVTLTITLL